MKREWTMNMIKVQYVWMNWSPQEDKGSNQNMNVENVVTVMMLILLKYHPAFKKRIDLFPQYGVWIRVSNLELRFRYLGLVFSSLRDLL